MEAEMYAKLVNFLERPSALSSIMPYKRGVNLYDATERRHDSNAAYVYSLGESAKEGVVTFDENGEEGRSILIVPGSHTTTTYFIHSPYRQPQTAWAIIKDTGEFPPRATDSGSNLIAKLLGSTTVDDIATRLAYIGGQKVALRMCKAFMETWAFDTQFAERSPLNAPRNIPNRTVNQYIRDPATKRLQDVLRRGLDASYLAVRLVQAGDGLLTLTPYEQKISHAGEDTLYMVYTLSTPTARSDSSSLRLMGTDMVLQVMNRLNCLRIVRNTRNGTWYMYIRANQMDGTEPTVWVIVSPCLYDGRYILYVWRQGEDNPVPLAFDGDLTLSEESCRSVNRMFNNGVTVVEVPPLLELQFKNGSSLWDDNPMPVPHPVVERQRKVVRGAPQPERGGPRFTTMDVDHDQHAITRPHTSRNVDVDDDHPPPHPPEVFPPADMRDVELASDRVMLTNGILSNARASMAMSVRDFVMRCGAENVTHAQLAGPSSIKPRLHLQPPTAMALRADERTLVLLSPSDTTVANQYTATYAITWGDDANGVSSSSSTTGNTANVMPVPNNPTITFASGVSNLHYPFVDSNNTRYTSARVVPDTDGELLKAMLLATDPSRINKKVIDTLFTAMRAITTTAA